MIDRVYWLPLFIVFLLGVGPGCTGSNIRQLDKNEKSHDRNGWLLERSLHYNIKPAEAEKRDLSISENEPLQSEDEALKKEAALLWRDLCSLCHGVKGDPKDSLILDPKPRKFGTFSMKMGFFFGGNKMRVGIYRVIRDGKGERMPAFGKQLTREQMWALVKYIERL